MAGIWTDLEGTEQNFLSDGGHISGPEYWVWGGITGDKWGAWSQKRSSEERVQVKEGGKVS